MTTKKSEGKVGAGCLEPSVLLGSNEDCRLFIDSIVSGYKDRMAVGAKFVSVVEMDFPVSGENHVIIIGPDGDESIRAAAERISHPSTKVIKLVISLAVLISGLIGFVGGALIF